MTNLIEFPYEAFGINRDVYFEYARRDGSVVEAIDADGKLIRMFANEVRLRERKDVDR